MQALTLPRGFEVVGNSFTLTNSYDPFVSTDYIKYLQAVGDKNIYVYGEGGVNLLEINSYFSKTRWKLLFRRRKDIQLLDKESPVTLNLFGGDGNDLLGFSNSGSSKLYGGSGVDSAKLAKNHLETDGFLFEKFKLRLQSNGIVLEGSNELLTPSSTSTFISEDIEIIYDKSGGYLMSDLLSGLTVKYTDEELEVILDRMKTGNYMSSTTTPVASKTRTNEYGSRVPKNFDGSGSALEGVADIFGTDSATSDPSSLENYDGFWYYPKEDDDNLVLNGGDGKDALLSYSDQALYNEDSIKIT